jgi:hypothetical protein
MRPEFTFADYVALSEQLHRTNRGVERAAERWLRRYGVALSPEKIAAQQRQLRGVCDAMTMWESERAAQLNPSRRRRIATGAGVRITRVSEFIRGYENMRSAMLGSGELPPSRTHQGTVLGLVTSDAVHRDPSHVQPLLPRSFFERLELLFALVAVAAVVALWVAQHH